LDAFDELVRRHQAGIARCLYRFCPNGADLEDLAQETFVKAYRRLDLWRPEAPFANWLRRIAYNAGYDYFRRSRRNPASVSRPLSEAEERAFEQLPSPERDARLDRESLELVQKILSGLAPDERTLLTLQYLEGLSLAEIAEQMGWSLSNAKVKSFRARRKLQSQLDRDEIADQLRQLELG